MNYVRKKKPGRLLSSPFVLILFIGILLIFARALWNLADKYKFSSEKHDRYVAELQKLVEKKGRLETNLEMLGTERGQEEKIREKFRVTKDGEEVIIIIDDAGESAE